MTRKDYEIIAKGIQESYDFLESLGTPPEDRNLLVTVFARSLAEDNPRFAAVRFAAACGATI